MIVSNVFNWRARGVYLVAHPFDHCLVSALLPLQPRLSSPTSIALHCIGLCKAGVSVYVGTLHKHFLSFPCARCAQRHF